MKALKKKWSSNRGATIFLALLFMMLCVMVGASVLAAAASNGGKIKTNREQQQNYYTVSSALTHVCSELADGVAYVGQYQYVREEEWDVDDEGVATQEGGTEHYFYQTQGKLDFDSGDFNINAMTEMAPLLNGMDNIFHEYFDQGNGMNYDVEDTHDWTSDLETRPGPFDPWNYSWEFIVTVTPPGDWPEEPEEDEAWLSEGQIKPVHVFAKLDNKGNITLTATLYAYDASGDETTPVYSMSARMKPVLTGSDLRSILSPNVDGLAGDDVFVLYLDGDDEDHYTDNSNYPDKTGSYWNVAAGTTEPVTWELDYIKKGTS